MVEHTRYPYESDGEYIEKSARVFSPSSEIVNKFESIQEGAQVNTIENISVNGVTQTIDQNKKVDISVPEVVDYLISSSTEQALSANQGRILYGYIQSLQSIGKFLSNWNCASGLPTTNPQSSPYEYNSGDYYIISNVSTGTNYRPDGSSYTSGVASTVVETEEEIKVGDMYVYDGTSWLYLVNTERKITIDSTLSTTSTNPAENQAITNAINTKQNTLTAGNNIQIVGNTISATDTTYGIATSSVAGIAKLGNDTTQTVASNSPSTMNSRTYPVQLDSTDHMVVNVPWTDNNTTYNAATTSTLGLMKLGSSTVQTEAAESPTSVADRTYPIQFNNDNQAVVNVPWTDTTYSAGTNVQINGTTISATDTTYTDSDFDIKDLSDSTNLRASWSGKQEPIVAGTNIQIDADGVTISATDTTYTAGANVQISNGNVISATDTTYTAGTNVQISAGNVISATDTTYGTATNTTPGLVKLGSAVVQTEAAQSPTTTSARTYPVQLDSDSQMVVNVPWTDNSQYYAGTGLNLTNHTFSADTEVMATKADVATKQDTLTAGANITIDGNNEISAVDTTYSAGTNVSISANNEISAVDTTYNTATKSVAGLVKLGSDTVQSEAAQTPSSSASRTYPVQLNGDDEMVVNVPWTDNNTTYSAGTNVQISSGNVISATDTTYSTATTSTEGLIKLGSDTVQSTAANNPSSTADRTYPIQLNSDGQAVVNVPWSDTTTGSATSSVAGTVKLFSDTTQSVAANAVSSTAGKTYGLQENSNGQLVVNVPWTDTTYSAGANISISGGEISAIDTTYATVTKSDMDTGTGTTAGVVTAKDISDFVKGKISNAYIYKGSVNDYSDLPSSGNVAGDIYNVKNAFDIDGVHYPAGTNVARTGTGWDPLGGTVDLSNYVTLNGTQTISGVKTYSAEPILPAKTTAPSSSNSTKPATEAQVAGMVSNNAYDATTWDGVTAIAPSKNAVRDKLYSMDTTIAGKQDTLVAGTNITIASDGKTISATDTTYSTMSTSTEGIAKLGSDTVNTATQAAVSSTAGRTYLTQLDSNGKLVVNVPWQDNDTTYSTMSTTNEGIAKLGDNTTQTVAANAVSATADRTYATQLNADGQLVVNVPWTDTNTTYSTATSSTAGIVKLGSDTAQSVAANAVSSDAGRTYAIQKNSSDQMVVNVPWSDTTYSNLTSSAIKTGTATTQGTVTPAILAGALPRLSDQANNLSNVKVRVGTKANYDTLTKDANTLYFCTDS